ncbi:XRE family transcriptional regulator [Clostridium chromiireducens]|uniref:XRE family transcriptional regulator n=1 Tax=Clostridium chromiireducens TaxID=225345 RepID=A0A399IN33_9CLOT|nr:helix-turn-helix transcriptional regulator [Clostridium chromiireducens]RII34341.1 XRE family transcriptional regulator [Clostridium chromiireducens]
MIDTLGKRIKMLRENLGITKAQLMKELNINNLGRFEADERTPGIDIIIALSKYFNVSIDFLVVGEEAKQEFSNEDSKVKHILGDLSDEEIHFIDLLRQVDEKEKNKIEGMLELKIAEAQTNKKGMSSTYLSGDEAATKENLA